MSISADEFKKGMRRLAGAVNIVTTTDGSVKAGLTATAVTSLSAEPPRILVCVNRAGVTYETIIRGRTLGVSILSMQHKELAMQFAGMTNLSETDRFEKGAWMTDVTGAPLLKNALASFDCDVEDTMNVGSHCIVIGNIRAVHTSGDAEASPLCYADGTWTTLSPL
ncbi:flavin reductase family protein [Kordiimonas aquimaris]|uniref:flavin reductase family protein n=1 Tax=Kordiimonas aquimaris TaxID=707591 RepID=UPI0021CF1280|nr:flavin reductase family protein [Kordiimonas aquimaris]